MRFLVLLFMVFSAIAPAACTFEEDPDFFIDNMRPDLYFALKQPDGAVAASVAFTTKKPAGPTLPLNVRVLAWSQEGDNIYQGTLEETLLDTPTEGKSGELLHWSGTVGFPTGLIPGDDPSAEYIGIELRTFMPIAAFNGPPQAGEFCEADFMGAGITGCGSWFEVFVRQWAVCRGAVGQLVDCHGLHYALLPSLYVRGIGKNRTGVPDVSRSDVMPNVLYTSELYLYQDASGWHYKALEPLDFYTQPGSSFEDRIAERHAYGPFTTSEEAARDAVAQLGLRPGLYAGFSELAAQYAPGTELHRAAMVLEELLDADAPALPPTTSR